MHTNVFIFRENLKLIINCCIDQLCTQQLNSDVLDGLVNKGYQEPITAIREEDEKGQVSEGISRNSGEDQVGLKVTGGIL